MKLLKTRIIPTLLWKNIGLVKGVGFDNWRIVSTVLPAIKVYNTRQVDELIIVDILATKEGSEIDLQALKDFSAECFVPLTVGGGIKNIEDVRKILCAGADKVSINSALFETPELVTEISNKFGTQCVVAGIDAKNLNDKYECFSHSGTKPTGKEVSQWAKYLESLGAGEILITSIEKDGTMNGYDLDLIKLVTDSVKIPVIASGGAGNYDDMYRAINEANASAVAAASIYHFTEQTPLEAKKYLASKNIPVRNVNNSNIKKGTL
jgi:cyclase